MADVTDLKAEDALNTEVIKKDFPILDVTPHGKRLVYLDSASSSQKPRAVLEAMDHYYETTHANVHRGVYAIAEESTRLFEEAATRRPASSTHLRRAASSSPRTSPRR